jgi:hypothetical protein
VKEILRGQNSAAISRQVFPAPLLLTSIARMLWLMNQE